MWKCLFFLFSGIIFAEQTPWINETVPGFSLDKGKLDYTEGLGAYMDLHLKVGTKNFDNGGGSHDYNTLFLKDNFGVDNFVYDPFQRSEEHNNKVLEEVKKKDFDTVTSNSVLNVIDDLKSRFNHIFLSCESLKNHGKAYFRIYEGDGSSLPKTLDYGFQSNRSTKSYQEEVEYVFQKGNVVTDYRNHLIIAYKNNDCMR
ncbi:MAG: hypothetical protein V4489_09965 [Chlamydiota bacterium]